MRTLLRSRTARLGLGAVLTTLAIAARLGRGAYAQEPAMRWDGLLEGVSVQTSYWWDQPVPGNASSRLNRHAVSADGRYVLLNSDATNFNYFQPALYLRDRNTGETRILFGGPISVASISADGNHVAFVACNWWNGSLCDVYAMDLRYWTVRPISTSDDGATLGDSDSFDPIISSNGRFVVFQTNAGNLLPQGAAPGQIVLRDRDPDQNGIYDEPGLTSMQVASVSSLGEVGDGPSETPEVSDDGRYVAFRSSATNLVPADTNGVWDVFRRDLLTGETRRLNVRTEAQQSYSSIDSPQISMTPDGRYVAFTSVDGFLAPSSVDDTNNLPDVFVYDAFAPFLTRLDVGYGPPIAGGYVPGNGPTEWPSFSADGRYVTLHSRSTNTEVPNPNAFKQVYVYDRLLQKPTRISINPNGSQPNHESFKPQISADGSAILFTSPATNILQNAPPDVDQVYAAVHLEVTPSSVTVPGRGGSRTFTVTAQRHTRWTAIWDWTQYWLNPDMPSFGVGDGTFSFVTNAPNPDPTPRSMTIRVNNAQEVTFTQEAGLSLSSITPTSGPMDGGTQVTFHGTGFEPDMRVLFEGYEATSVQLLDTTTLVATTAPHAAGTVYVGVFTSDYRFAWLDQAFHFTDTTPPFVYPYASGIEGLDGWFTSDVTVSFYFTDPDSAITSQSGCDFTNVTTDTAGTTFTCAATSEGGTTTQSITVKRDATRPFGYTFTPNGALYRRGEIVSTNYSCGDATSGIQSCVGPVPRGANLDTTVPGGHYYFDVLARDRAGNYGGFSTEYAISSGVCEPRPSGLVGWWPGDQHYRDIAGGHDGTLVNGTPIFNSGPVGPSMVFIQSRYLSVQPTPALEMHNALTLSAWVYLVRDWLAPYSVIAGREGEFLLARGPDGNIQYSIANTNPGWGWVSTGVSLDRERWTKVALTYDGTWIRVYKNGLLVYIRPASGTIGDVSPTMNEFRIAAREDPAHPYYFDGSIDDVELLDRAMEWDEIDRAYLSGDMGLCPLPVDLAFTPSPQHATYGTTATLAARLTQAGQPVAGERIDFTFRGISAGYALIDATGVAQVTVSISGMSAGTYAGAVQASHAPRYFGYVTASGDFIVDKATPIVTVTGGTFTYDGGPHPSTGTVTGVGGVVLGGPAITYNGSGSAPVNAGSYNVVGTWSASTNYTAATGTATTTINKAAPTVTVYAGTFTYDGSTHAATGSVTGVAGASLGSPTFTYNGSAVTPVDGGIYAVVGSYAGSTNYTAATGTATLTINRATPTVAVNGGTFAYDATPHPATGSVTGVGGASLGSPTFTYNGSTSAPVDAGTYNVVGTYAGNTNYAAATGNATITIDKVYPTVTVTGGTFTYDATAHPATGSVTGVGGVSLGPLVFTYNGSPDAPIDAGSYGVLASYAGDSNYLAFAAKDVLTIVQATPIVSVTGGAFIYDAAPHSATGSVTGVGGVSLGSPTFTYNGSAALPVDAGSYDVIATFAGNANYAQASATAPITIGKATPVVSATGGSFVYDGAAHPATGTVTGVGGVSLGMPTFSYNGSPTAPVNAGSYEVVASYAGNVNYVAATATAAITIGKATPTLSWVPPAPIVYGTALAGGQLNATATVAGTFGYTPGAGTVLAAGAERPLSAVFTPADPANYTGGTIGTTIDVAPAPLSVRANDAVKPFGAPLPAFTATFSGLVNGDTPASLAGSLALTTAATANSPVNGYPIVPSGVSSPNYTIAFINGTLTIVRASVLVSVGTTPEPSGLDQPMTFSATVVAAPPGAGSPTGIVRFFDGLTLLGSSVLTGGTASLATAGLDAGPHTIEARYDGNSSFDIGASSATHTVSSAANTPSVTLSSSRNPSNSGQSVTFTANVGVAAGSVGGVVEFYDGGTLIGSSTLAAGRATLTTVALAVGSHAMTARYAGSVDAPPSRSAVLVQAVAGTGSKSKSSTLALTATPNPAALGGSVDLVATVTGSMATRPTGSVLFVIDGLVVGNPLGEPLAPLSGSNARATLPVSGLAHGRHKVTATYLGDLTYKGSTSAVTETVD